MKLTRLLLLAALGLPLTACAGGTVVKSSTNAVVSTPVAAAPSGPSTLMDKLVVDLTQAIADAKASTDLLAPQRAKCYTTLLGMVPVMPTLAAQSHPSAGVIDTFELAAERVEDIAALADYQLPPAMKLALVVDCGPLRVRAADLLVLFNLKLVNAAGALVLIPK